MIMTLYSRLTSHRAAAGEGDEPALSRAGDAAGRGRGPARARGPGRAAAVAAAALDVVPSHHVQIYACGNDRRGES